MILCCVWLEVHAEVYAELEWGGVLLEAAVGTLEIECVVTGVGEVLAP